jgi:hypothetical protein
MYTLVKCVKPSNIQKSNHSTTAGLTSLRNTGVQKTKPLGETISSVKLEVNKPQIDLGTGRIITLKLFLYKLGLDWIQLAITVLHAVDVDLSVRNPQIRSPVYTNRNRKYMNPIGRISKISYEYKTA